MTFHFKNKTVLITGGTRGIGFAASKLFAAAGASVIMTYRSDHTSAQTALTELTPGRHQIFQLDVSEPAAIKDFFEACFAENKQLDVLVNNAGIYIEHKIATADYADWLDSWDKTLAANLKGPANMWYWASKLMITQGSGKIINISSRGAFRGEPDHPAYGASKAGLNAMSQSLAIALAPYGISVHIIAPGFVETEMAEEILNGPQGEGIKNQSPFGRVAKPEEVARLIAIYASDGLEFTSAGIVDINGASYLRS